jgi:hypothetical protein
MSNLEEFCKFDKIYEEVFEEHRRDAAAYFYYLDRSIFKSNDESNNYSHKAIEAIQQIFPHEQYEQWHLNSDDNKKIIEVPKISFDSVDKVLELQENMKMLESDSKTLAELMLFLGKFYKIKSNERYNSNHDVASQFQKIGEEFIEFLDKKGNNNKILKNWHEKIKPEFISTLETWREEIDFIEQVYSTGLALYKDSGEGINIKPVGIFEEEERGPLLRKINSQISKGVKKGTINIGDVILPFNLSIGHYNVSHENSASIIKGHFPYYSGIETVAYMFTAPFKELDHYLRFIYLTKDKDSPFCYPKFNSNNELLFDAKNMNPYFLKVLENEKNLTTNNLRITRNKNIVFVSGSNNGGKTTLLRNIGLIYNLAYHGAKVPATSCTLSPVDGINIYEPEVGFSSGTFKSNLTALKEDLEIAEKHPNYLYIVDEPIIGGTNLSAMKQAFDRFATRVSELKGTTIIATNHSEYLRECNSPKFLFYAMNKKHKINPGIGDSEGESIIKEVGF